MNPQAAQRWVAKAHIDENTCDPCKNNDGKTYRNRQQAYADYPGGKGYAKCEGRSNCRCTVVKRGKASNSMDPKMQRAAELVGSRMFSARALAAVNLAKLDPTAGMFDPPEPGFRAAAPVNGQNGQLHLYDAIGGWDGIMAIDVVKALADMTGDLDVHVNSGGGSIFEGSAIFNAIAGYTGGKKIGFNDGVAASAGSFILMACDEVVVADNAVTMIHDGAAPVFGTPSELRDMADVLDMLSDNIAKMYARKTGGSAAEWREIMSDGDTWYNAQEAVDAGLADRVVGATEEETEDTKVTNAFDLGIFTARATSGVSSPNDIEEPLPLTASAVAGLRDALKGAFA
jgi:ATP-dependent protease ClpP protease subunit